MPPLIPVKALPDEFVSELGATSARTLSQFHRRFSPSTGIKEYYLIQPLQLPKNLQHCF